MANPDTDTDTDVIDADFTDTGLETTNDRPAPLAIVDRQATALAAAAEAQIKAQVWAARSYPRNLPSVLDRALAQVKRPAVAERAVYAVPRGGQTIEGLSIKAANILRAAMGNIITDDMVVADTDEYRTITVSAMDLESNTSERRTVVVSKTVERKGRRGRDGKPAAPDREVIGAPRLNSYGDLVWKCRATEDEIVMVQNAACSKARRNCILALVPQDIQDALQDTAQRVKASVGAKNRAAALDSIRQGFSRKGITTAEVSAYLGRELEQATVEEITMLQGLVTSIVEGHVSWKEVVRSREEAREAAAEPAPTATPPPATGRKRAADAVDAATK